MAEKDEPKPGSVESWESKYLSKENNPTMRKLLSMVNTFFTGPPRYFHEKIVKPNQGPEYPYYHRQYRRVPTIDECYMSDYVCFEEADLQYRRDKKVEEEIIKILAGRVKDCLVYNDGQAYGQYGEVMQHADTSKNPCQPMIDKHLKAQQNFYVKYGDLPWHATARDVFMKQKHRMIWERRYGENTLDAKRERLAAMNASSSDGE